MLLCGLWSHQSYAQDDSLSLVEHAVRLRSPGDDWPRHVHLERTIEEAQKATGLEDPFGDEFYRQVTAFLNVEHSGSWKIQHLLNLINLLGDERAAPGLVRVIERRLEYADYAFRILAEIDPNNPAIDRLIARAVDRALAAEGPPFYGVPAEMLHLQRSDLAIENAEKIIAFIEAERERLDPEVAERWWSEEMKRLSNIGGGAGDGLAIAKLYRWLDTEPPEVVVRRLLDARVEGDMRTAIGMTAHTRVMQSLRRRGLVDLFAERARERIMELELGSGALFLIYQDLESLRVKIDDELALRISDSMAERRRQMREQRLREQEAAPDRP
ncbi:MAG: hypothetical protein EA376_11160 [Phycisphaeraceae bacterium]|nr:MAG: hypothetical protein EA376_11160 [Phycisphaeraceae bacterium]